MNTRNHPVGKERQVRKAGSFIAIYETIFVENVGASTCPHGL
jgi:hypothetical protein